MHLFDGRRAELAPGERVQRGARIDAATFCAPDSDVSGEGPAIALEPEALADILDGRRHRRQPALDVVSRRDPVLGARETSVDRALQG